LIHKLKLYNIDTSWFSSYLNERFQQTNYDLQNVLSWCNSNNMSLNDFKTKIMYISTRHKQQTFANCDHDISICICDGKIQVSSVEKTSWCHN